MSKKCGRFCGHLRAQIEFWTKMPALDERRPPSVSAFNCNTSLSIAISLTMPHSSLSSLSVPTSSYPCHQYESISRFQCTVPGIDGFCYCPSIVCRLSLAVQGTV